MKKRLLTIAGALLLAGSLPVASFAASTKQFSDVPSTKHFAEAVYDLADRNIIGGYPDGTFKPGNPITRGQAAAIIAKMTNLDMDNVKNPGFKDVTTSNGSYKAIAALSENGIISGYGDGKFGPNDPIKRGQMASILVKAFDLPRESVTNNPFTDIDNSLSHRENILAIYALGITTGTTPTTFSPNAPITRGQAAKMLKATEEAKPSMLTLKASDLKWTSVRVGQTDTGNGVFKVFKVNGKEGYTEDKIQLVPLKEGTGLLNLLGTPIKGSNVKDYKKYNVHVKKVNGELQLTLEETEEMAATEVKLYGHQGKVKTIALSTMEGKQLSDQVPFKEEEFSTVSITIDQPGQYIATLKLEDGKEVRYGIEAQAKKEQTYYDITVLKEEPSAVYKEIAEYKGKYKLSANSADIAEITFDADTNTFHIKATGKKEGTIYVDYEQRLTEKSCDDTECYFSAWSGLIVGVKQMGSIVNVFVKRDAEIDH
ncbi:S-layer homology domain-containing protein [Sporosarcina cyprini]|uniref:S-layer homology domain-containing protein n=1 Tax=Sporosarcina cyprini TaxID=2910523 RepID=UPI001EDFBC0D|nr:S-layer homology domain-containing protein [Sporosarcina cyprini]MCG3088359.1 S-layer homology domain-containing protein [Sporosarcina cyprini]